MPTTDVEPVVVIEPGTGDPVVLSCMVCPHSWDAHDRIGVRFCTATAAAGLLNRGCVCIGNTN